MSSRGSSWPRARVPPHQAGLASGLSNTALQIGTAVGVAIVTTVAVTRASGYQAAHAAASRLAAATEGYQSAFWAGAALAAIGLALALGLPRQPRPVAGELPEPAPATNAGD